jgi:multiple sugar transport system ATP-binding protein
MAHLELRNIEKRYSGGNEAVGGISFAAEKGEFIVMVGPSGCGKSTTLRMVAGLEDISSGEIFINGKQVNTLAPKDRDVAMVFQNYALYPHFTVKENIAFPLTIRKESTDVIEREVTKAAELLSITHLLARKPKELSGGERQRVAVGRAIVRKPQVFLFDEPLSNLDAALRSSMRAELKNLQRELGTTMLYVTHDQTEAMTMGDRIVVLNRGKLEQYDSPEDIYRKPATSFVARFLGSPSMNMMVGTLEGGVFTSGEFRLPLHSTISHRTAQLGVRPESVSIVTDDLGEGMISGTLSLIEPLGSVTNYYIETGDATFIASINGFVSTDGHKLGDPIHLKIHTADIHLFDSVSGMRLN